MYVCERVCVRTASSLQHTVGMLTQLPSQTFIDQHYKLNLKLIPEHTEPSSVTHLKKMYNLFRKKIHTLKAKSPLVSTGYVCELFLEGQVGCFLVQAFQKRSLSVCLFCVLFKCFECFHQTGALERVFNTTQIRSTTEDKNMCFRDVLVELKLIHTSHIRQTCLCTETESSIISNPSDQSC